MELTKELVIEKLDGTTIRRKYVDWQTFRQADLEKLKLLLETELAKVNDLLGKFL